MKKNLLFLKKSLLPLLILLPAISISPAFAAMDDYCVSPAFLEQPIPPNIMIVLDNSGSMCNQAYPGDYDPTNFSNGLYYGYFDGEKNYKYTSNGRWEVTTDAMTTGTTANPIAKGSFLNWATMRRTEVSKKLLIGGKATSRSPEGAVTVKLLGETKCNDRSFNKDFDTSAGDLIYPFLGDYNFARDTSDTLTVTSSDPSYQFNIRPKSDISIGSWRVSPAHTKVDDTWNSNFDTDYIENIAVSNPDNVVPVIMDFDYTDATPSGTLTVKVYTRARKTVSHQRLLRGVLRIGGVDFESSTITLDKEYPFQSPYNFTWETNPSTNAAWKWDEIKQIATSGNLEGFGVKAGSDYSANTIRVTQVYLRVEITHPNGGPYNTIVDQGMTKAEGLIDYLDNEARFGLAYYNHTNAGRVKIEIGFKAPTNMATDIGGMVPSTWTPLGETLREMVGYFRQDDPYYNNSPADYSVGSGDFGSDAIYGDPYAYKFTDVDSDLTNMYVKCAKSFILYLTDGESTYDTSMAGDSTTSPYAACSSTNIKACSGYGGAPNNPNPRFAGTPIGQTYTDYGTDYLIDVAYWARTNDMRPGTETDVPTTWRKSLPGIQNVILYPIFMFGTGSSLLKDAAIYGGFVDKNNNNKPDCTTNPAECYKDSDGDGTIESNGDDLPLTYYEGDDGYALEQNIKDAIDAINERAASSTAVSVLSSQEGSGATLVQSLFYPRRSFSNSAEITWTSDVMNYWYYFDPYFKNSQIREDTIRDNFNDTLLDLRSDYITAFYFDAEQQKTLAARCQDTDGDGDCDTMLDPVPIEEAKALWRAGVNLWWTEETGRQIWTSLDGSTLIPFDTSNEDVLDDYLGLTASDAAANATIDYVRGVDIDKFCSGTKIPCSADTDCSGSDTCIEARSRTVQIKVCTISKNLCSTDDDCGDLGGNCVAETHTWKLGDVISSTPRIMGPSPLNNYNISPPIGYADTTYQDFIRTSDYKDRQRVFVGSNDGLFHAFRLGKVEQRWTGKEWWQPGRLVGTEGTNGIGTESWAFIPKNVLPYLQYLSDPDYCHIYTVDGPISLFDASINCTEPEYWNCAKQTSSWRSITIGSMGLGGATSSVADSDCVQTPLNVGATPVGWSSYFALDVTNQDTPTLLWEFNHPDLGVSNVGPVIVRIGDNQKRCASNNAVCTTNNECGALGQCVDSNGRWFAILASGSTGPIVTKNFNGTSDQTLKLFILDLKTGGLLRTIDTGITNAFAGSISSSTIDLERGARYKDGHYNDDVVYIGYVQNETNGGVIRLVMNDDINTASWTASKVIDNIGPVTTSVVNLFDPRSNKLWLYFAEGRYFHKQDDPNTTRKLFGIQEPCYVKDTSTNIYDVLPACNNTTTLSNLKDQTSSPTALTAIQTGWYVELDPASSTNLLGAERVISNPTPDTLGAIYFLSFAPNSDICGYGGTTYVWALDYKTGGQVTYTMQGKALVQVSTGEIKEIDMSTAFTGKNNRRTVGFPGIPPVGQGLMVIVNPVPTRQYMHIQEQ
jgi:type IV pilus assembly protein PilY1